MAESSDDRKNNFRELCYHIGLALVTWQRVEDLHFEIFGRFLGVPLGQITSAAYHSIENFEARNAMLGRMAYYFLHPIEELIPRPLAREYKATWIEWQKLYKSLKDANLNRNKLAHYAADYDLINMRNVGGDIVFDVTPHTLRPSPFNYVSRLLGRTKDQKEHNLGVPEIGQYVINFREVEAACAAFIRQLGKLPAPHAPIDKLNPASPSEYYPSQSKPPPEDEPPSAQ
jgi:hypothetical protein